MFENDFKDFMVEETIVKKEWLCSMKCLKNVSNIKETADVTLATDDDKQLEAHKKSFTNYQASNLKNKLPIYKINFLSHFQNNNIYFKYIDPIYLFITHTKRGSG